MLTEVQIITAMNALDNVILNGATKEIQIAAYEAHVALGEMLFNGQYTN